MLKKMNNITNNQNFPFDTDILRQNLNFSEDFGKKMKIIQEFLKKK
jgi:hypothetical protein